MFLNELQNQTLEPTNKQHFSNSLKHFSFQNQESFSKRDSKENFEESKNFSEINCNESNNEMKNILKEQDPNIFRNKISKEIEDINQILESKSLILRKLKANKPNNSYANQEKYESSDHQSKSNKIYKNNISLNTSNHHNNHILINNNNINNNFDDENNNNENTTIKSTSTIKKHLNFQDKDSALSNELFENTNENYENNQKGSSLYQDLRRNTILVEDYRKQIDLLEKNYEHQRGLQIEINEYRKLITSFEEKINLLIDDNQRLVSTLEAERQELAKYKEMSDGIIKNCNEKILNLEKETRFKEERYNELLICLDEYKSELEKMKDYKVLSEKERIKLLEENKNNSLKLIEIEKNDQKLKNEQILIKKKAEKYESEDKMLKCTKAALETKMREILQKNKDLNANLNERIVELNQLKKTAEKTTNDFKIEQEKQNFVIQQLKTQINEEKNQKSLENNDLKKECKEIRAKFEEIEIKYFKNQEIITKLEGDIERLEIEKKNINNSLEITKKQRNYDLERLEGELQKIQQENQKIFNENFILKGENAESIRKIQELQRNLAQNQYNFQKEIENFHISTNHARSTELNEISQKLNKEIQEKNKLINDLLEKNKEISNNLEYSKQKTEEYKQKLIKMDSNYSKSMKELQFAYEQERKVKEKNFALQYENMNQLLSEKEKLISSFSKEKEELLNILKKTTDNFQKQNYFHDINKILAKENINSNRWNSMKTTIRNHSAERDVLCDKKQRNSFEYRRSLHSLHEKDYFNKDILNKYMQYY